MIPKQFFISYAHEDVQIADALRVTLQQIDDTFVVVNMDKLSLESGVNFRDQIQEKLQRSEVLFVVHSDATKPAFSYTGWEVGYFEGVHRHQRTSDDPTDQQTDQSTIISLYLGTPPAAIADRQGISLNISKDDLRLDIDEFESKLNTEVTKDHPMVRFMDGKRLDIAVERKKADLPKSREVDTVQSVRQMLLSIFVDRKNSADTTLKPQKQITIKTRFRALQDGDGDLPPDALLVPVGGGTPMSVFGLLEQPLTWAEFGNSVASSSLGVTWVQAIRAVIASSFPNQINVDNSQIVLSPDDHIYRLILTTSTTYFNGNLDVNLYLVEALRRPDEGDPTTTRLLKGLELASRFRSLFLEKDSRFFALSLKLMRRDALREAAHDIVTELNLLQRDAREAGLHEAAVWGGLVDWTLLEQISEEWRPRDQRIREICALLSAATTAQKIDEQRGPLVTMIEDLETTLRPLNQNLIIQMASRLLDVVRRTDVDRVAESSAKAGGI
jgi:hypothetical protein